MPKKVKTSAQQKASSTINGFVGIILFVALIIGLYFAFNYARELGVFESGAEIKAPISNEVRSGKERIGNTMKDVKKASDLNNRTGGL